MSFAFGLIIFELFLDEFWCVFLRVLVYDFTGVFLKSKSCSSKFSLSFVLCWSSSWISFKRSKFNVSYSNHCCSSFYSLWLNLLMFVANDDIWSSLSIYKLLRSEFIKPFVIFKFWFNDNLLFLISFTIFLLTSLWVLHFGKFLFLNSTADLNLKLSLLLYILDCLRWEFNFSNDLFSIFLQLIYSDVFSLLQLFFISFLTTEFNVFCHLNL